MLRQFHISGMGIVDDLELELHSGLNVLTGETGTGKTMITVGLVLALGGRGSASLVRREHPAARVQARFDAPPGTEDWAEDGELILARSVGADGRSTARIGGQLATASALADLGRALVEVHGQHQSQRLLSGSVQTAFLDRFAGDRHLVALAAYREAFEERRKATDELSGLIQAGRDREREMDLLAYQIREIEAAGIDPGELLDLDREESRLGHAERLMELAATAGTAIAADGGAADALAAAASAIDAAAALDPGASELANRLGSLSAESTELARDLGSYGSSLQIDPERVQWVRERAGMLKGLQRKYGASEGEVLRFLGSAQERRSDLEGADDRSAVLHAKVAELDALCGRRADLITRRRQNDAPRLAAAISAELEELGMPGGHVEIALPVLAEPGPAGAERVELLLSPGPSQDALPLAKAASGGELSRTMLACRSVLADLDETPTLIFDEVDAGIGGAAGLAVGRRLARLATERQVIVVTHLPQIACFADLHACVSKTGGSAAVHVVQDGERVLELSRMLAGLPGSASASSHAEELLSQASRVRRASQAVGAERPAPA